MSGRREAVFLLIERALLALGVVCLGYVGYAKLEARNFQREQAAAFERLLLESATSSQGATGATGATAATGATGVTGATGALSGTRATIAPVAPSRTSSHPVAAAIALIEIPRLNVSAPVVSGDGPKSLDVAIGHLPDTPTPWEGGNTALAAHRDGLFRPLKNIRIGDDVRVRSVHGEFVYRVRDTKIVMPDDLSVLGRTDTDTLTLITCYPFNYIGHAPKRFIVHAERVTTAGTQ